MKRKKTIIDHNFLDFQYFLILFIDLNSNIWFVPMLYMLLLNNFKKIVDKFKLLGTFSVFRKFKNYYITFLKTDDKIFKII